MSEIELFDTTVIGGGPSGLFASFYAGLRGLKTKIIDSLPELGGQLAALYPEKYIFDFPGYPQVIAGELVKQLIDQTMRFSPTVVVGAKTEKLEHLEDGTIRITTTDGIHYTKTIILCAGAGAFVPKNLKIEGLEKFEGKGVHYFVRSKKQFEGHQLLVVGGGDSALDWCMNLEPMVRSVQLVHRSDRFRAHDNSVRWLERNKSIVKHTFCEVTALHGDDMLQQVTMLNKQSGESITVDVDSLLMCLGFDASLGPIVDWGINLVEDKVLVDSHMQTNLPGVFAAGDICTYDGKLPLIATGVGEAATAANYVKAYVDPEARVKPGHSSHMPLTPTNKEIGHSMRDMNTMA